MRVLFVLLGVLVPVAAAAGGPDLDELGRKCAEGKPKDCAKLAQIARSDRDAFMRSVATGRLRDPAVLAEIARTDASEAVRMAAAGNRYLADPAVLAALARDPSDVVRRNAFENPNFTDQALLADIAIGDAARYLRPMAFKRITDQAALARCLMKMTHPALDTIERDRALAKVTDPALLGEIALNAEALMTRTAAFEKLTSVDDVLALGRRVGKDRTLDVDQRLVKLLPGATPDALERLAQGCVELDLKATCGRIVHLLMADPARTSTLVEMAIAMKDDRWALMARQIAEHVKDGSVEIARRAVRPDVRAKALARTANPPAELANDVLSAVLTGNAWPVLHDVWASGFPLSPANRSAVTALAASKRGLISNAAQAMLAGVPARRWPRLAGGPGVGIEERSSGVHPLPASLAPGRYSFTVTYRSSTYDAAIRLNREVRSTEAVTVPGTLLTDTCYAISAGANEEAGLPTWSPKLVEQPCRNAP